MSGSRTIIGIDPGLRHTGWGIIACTGNRLSYVAAGRVSPDVHLPMASRLLKLAEGIACILAVHHPDEAAIEETFVNKNAKSALLLGQARGAVILALAQGGLPVSEYAANLVKLSITGQGHAEKSQLQAMVAILLPGSNVLAPDAADALAVAVTHAHHASARNLARSIL